jgi:hypothetical protein
MALGRRISTDRLEYTLILISMTPSSTDYRTVARKQLADGETFICEGIVPRSANSSAGDPCEESSSVRSKGSG